MRPLRFVGAMIGLLFASVTGAQLPVWRYDVVETTYPSMARDPSGNVYLITREGTFSRNLIVLYKMSASGGFLFRTVIDSQSTDHSYRVGPAVADATRVYVNIEVTKTTSTSSTESTHVIAASCANGSQVWNSTTGNYLVDDMVLAGGNLVMTGTTDDFDPANRRAFLQGLNVATGGSLWTAIPSGLESLSKDIAVDGSGNVYIGGVVKSSGVLSMLCASYTSAGGYRFAVTSGVPGHSSASADYVAVDTSVDRVYVAGSGTYASPPNDLDSLVVAFRASDGGSVTQRTLDWSFGYDYAQGLAAQGGNVYIASYGDTPSVTDHMTALNSNLGNKWVFDEAGAGGYYRYFGFDNGGSVFYAKTFETGVGPDYSDTLVVKLRAADGQVRWRGRWNAGVSDFPTAILVTQAGDALVAGNSSYGSSTSVYVAKLAQAIFTTSQTAFPGGWSITGTITLSNPAMAPGSTFTLSSNKVQATVPGSVTLATGTSVKNFTIATQTVSTNTAVTLSAYWDNVQATTTIVVQAPVISSLTLTPSSVLGGINVTGTVNLTGKAPTGGTVVNLGSGMPGVGSVPPSITIPAGSTTGGFTITTHPVALDTSVSIHATTGASTKSVALGVRAPVLSNFAVTPGSVSGGSGATLTLTLSGKAPTGYVVQLLSGSPTFVTVPASTTMTSGSPTKNVAIATSPVTSTLSVTLIAYRGSVVKTATLTLTP